MKSTHIQSQAAFDKQFPKRYLNCEKYRLGICQSCTEISTDYDLQLQQKTSHLDNLLEKFITPSTDVLSAQQSVLSAFRFKAKMVATGQVERVTLGILNPQQEGIDLTDCPLYPESFQALFQLLKVFIQRVGLTPYNLQTKRGELKHIIINQSFAYQTFMVRFVLASHKKIQAIELGFPWLQSHNSSIKVVSANIQPIHQAILEGEEEIIFTEQRVLEESFNDIPLYIQPQSFFQTHPILASMLYQTAVNWVIDKPITKIWDLFCGVGGFGLHVLSALSKLSKTDTDTVANTARLTGIEISIAAIASAKLSAKQLGLESQIDFQALDAHSFAKDSADFTVPDLLIVNPPRRGLTTDLAKQLNDFQPEYILYSSCNAETLAKDLEHLTDYQLDKVQLFDFFPHTKHYEVLVLLRRNQI